MSSERKLKLVTNDQDPEIAKEFGGQEFTLNPKDFESIQVMITFTNPTSQSTEGQTPIYQLLQLEEKGMILEVPNRSCAQGHNLMLEVAAFGTEESVQFTCTAKVERLQKSDEGADEITISFLQYPENDWQKFKSLFGGRQDEIARFFAAAKGW